MLMVSQGCIFCRLSPQSTHFTDFIPNIYLFSFLNGPPDDIPARVVVAIFLACYGVICLRVGKSDVIVLMSLFGRLSLGLHTGHILYLLDYSHNLWC